MVEAAAGKVAVVQDGFGQVGIGEIGVGGLEAESVEAGEVPAGQAAWSLGLFNGVPQVIQRLRPGFCGERIGRRAGILEQGNGMKRADAKGFGEGFQPGESIGGVSCALPKWLAMAASTACGRVGE